MPDLRRDGAFEGLGAKTPAFARAQRREAEPEERAHHSSDSDTRALLERLHGPRARPVVGISSQPARLQPRRGRAACQEPRAERRAALESSGAHSHVSASDFGEAEPHEAVLDQDRAREWREREERDRCARHARRSHHRHRFDVARLQSRFPPPGAATRARGRPG